MNDLCACIFTSATSGEVPGADSRNPDRHGAAYIKGNMGSFPPDSPLSTAHQAWPIYLYQARGRQQEGWWGYSRGERGEAAWAGPVTHARGDGWGKPRGDSAQSDRLTSPSPLHEADIELANHRPVCLSTLCLSARGAVVCMRCVPINICVRAWWSVHALALMP